MRRIHKYKNDIDMINEFIDKNDHRKVVVIQGLGFVGSAMLTAVASATDKDGSHLYAVIGVDLPTSSGCRKIETINGGRLPVKSTDNHLSDVFNKCFASGNIMATADRYAYEVAEVIVVDINLDVKKCGFGEVEKNDVSFNDFVLAMRGVARKAKPSCLIIVESTVPPGTCEKVLLPLFKSEFKKRGFKNPEVNLAHSYERVMPGKNYLRSITSYYRVFSGINENSKRKARRFLETVIDVRAYPLTELESITADEMGKGLENSYRAVNIAFIQEWTEFAELAGVNLYKVIEGIKKRDTHRNIMYPGFGVGGYCLTKDSIIADWAQHNLFDNHKHLNMSVEAVNINDRMPLYAFNLMKKYLKNVRKKRILIMGVSYLRDVADTRSSPSEIFYRICIKYGASVVFHDPLVDYWPELGVPINNDLKSIEAKKMDAVVFAINHEDYLRMNPQQLARLLKPNGLVLDGNNVINDRKAMLLKKKGFKVVGVGKGHWNGA